MTTRTLLRAAGIFAWAFAGVPAVLHLARDASSGPSCGLDLGGATLVGWAFAFLVFGRAFWRASDRVGGKIDDPLTVRLVLLQAGSALGMMTLLCTGFESALLVVVAVELALLLSWRRALAALLAQSVALVGLAVWHMQWSGGSRWSFAVVGFELFAFTIAVIAAREAAARRDLARTNAELEAARDTVDRLGRQAERLRIARDLHDLLGHDLVALHLNLEAAKHLAGPRAAEPIERAQSVAKGLLADLRHAVSALREDDRPSDITPRLRALAEGLPAPRVHLDLPTDLAVEDEARADAVVRCVQELVTNSAKHARAENLWIEVVHAAGLLEVRAHDDGEGAAAIAPGNGLQGMRERIEGLGGELRLDSALGEGFRVRATLPMEV